MRSSLPTSVDTIDAATADSAPTTPASTTSSVDGSQASASSVPAANPRPAPATMPRIVPARGALDGHHLWPSRLRIGRNVAAQVLRSEALRKVRRRPAELGPEDTRRVHSPDLSDIRISIDATVAVNAPAPTPSVNQSTHVLADAESSPP